MTIQRGPKIGGEEVPLATVVHIPSAGCRGNTEVATRAHKNVFCEMVLDVGRHQRLQGEREFTTLGSDKTLGSRWQRGEYTPILAARKSCGQR